MGVNDDRLSAGEQNELRALVTAGAGRMRAARRRRMQAVTGGAAVLLVAAVVGAVALTAMGSPDRVAHPIETTTTTPSPTPSPDPTTTAPALPVAEVAPFGGSCEEALGVDRAAAWMGAEMRPIEEPWTNPEVTLSGGLHCLWAYPDSYQWGYIEVVAFPSSVFSETVPAPEESGACEDRECRSATVVDGLWVHLTWNAKGDADFRSIGPAELGELATDIGLRSTQFPAARPADRDPSGWAADACARLAAGVPDLSGAAIKPALPDLMRWPLEAAWTADLGVARCSAPSTGEGVGAMELSAVPGGGRLFEAIAASEGAEAVSVPGADGAVIVPENYLWERHVRYVVVRSGDNLLTLNPGDYLEEGDTRARVLETTGQAIAVLNGTVG